MGKQARICLNQSQHLRRLNFNESGNQYLPEKQHDAKWRSLFFCFCSRVSARTKLLKMLHLLHWLDKSISEVDWKLKVYTCKRVWFAGFSILSASSPKHKHHIRSSSNSSGVNKELSCVRWADTWLYAELWRRGVTSTLLHEHFHSLAGLQINPPFSARCSKFLRTERHAITGGGNRWEVS